MSVSAPIGENARFHCAGADAAAILWIVDELHATDTKIRAREQWHYCTL